MREKLIKILETVVSPKEVLCDGEVLVSTARVADHLIANGVTFREHDCHWATEQAYRNGYEAGKKDAAKWIPVTERLPDEFEQFLCIVIRPICGGKYVREYRVLWCDYDHSWNCDELIVTHWMPLPDLPKEG